MDLLNQYFIYLNFFSFGAMLPTSFALFFAFFLLAIKNKSPYTNALMKSFLLQGLFYSGYFIAAMFYHPLAAEHRLFTVFFIYPALLYALRFILLFPENNWPRFARALLILQWIIGIVLFILFFYITRTADKKFHFTAHYWDFDAEFISKIVAYFILLYIFIIPILGVARVINFRKQKHYRNALILFTIAMVLGTVLPGILNTLSRDGVVERSLFLNALVISVVVMIFTITVIFINVTDDRTTFMAKIIGITLSTFVLLMQGLAFLSLRDKEIEYDDLRSEYIEKSVYTEDYHPEMVFFIKFNPESQKISTLFEREDYKGLPPEQKLDYKFYLAELQNMVFYEKVKDISADKFKEEIIQLLEKTSPFFEGYKKSILNYLENYSGSDLELKASTLKYFDKLNSLTFVNYNRISFIRNDQFRSEVVKYLDKSKKEFHPFKETIQNYLKETKETEGKVLKSEIYEFLSPLRQQKTRIYLRSPDEKNHYIAYSFYDKQENLLYLGGYRYIDYRVYIHKPALQQTIIYIVIFGIITFFYPLFFRGSLIKPLEELLEGVKQVNRGDLMVKVPVYVQDEIGYLATSFNKMVVSIREAKEQLQDYANNLEEKVKERTAELNASLQEIRKLKQQQDGDYYLTSLLLKPLMVNFNKSKIVPSEFFVKQYKEFDFRGKISEIGGDICITGNLRLGKSLETAKRYIVAMNGDAMGKSTQGAGGALVMGVVMNSIIARSARHDRVLDMSPEQWLTDVYEEIHGIFSAFNGTMCISCIVDLIEEETGKMYYFNAEHPFQVLYRNGKASFIEEELKLRKLGLISEYPFSVQKFQLEPGDILIAGSDGRDDLQLESAEDGGRIINEDEYLFLSVVEESDGEISKIYENLQKKGKITDDISLLKLTFQPAEVKKDSITDGKIQSYVDEESFIVKESKNVSSIKSKVIVLDEDNVSSIVEDSGNEFEVLYEKGNDYLKNQQFREALEYYQRAYEINKENSDLNKKLAILTFRNEDYPKAVSILEKYLQNDPYIEDFWLYLSIAHKRVGNLDEALNAIEKAFELNQERIPILLQLADVHYKLNHFGRASIFVEKVLEKKPDNEQAIKLKKRIDQKIPQQKTNQ